MTRKEVDLVKEALTKAYGAYTREQLLAAVAYLRLWIAKAPRGRGHFLDEKQEKRDRDNAIVVIVEQGKISKYITFREYCDGR